MQFLSVLLVVLMGHIVVSKTTQFPPTTTPDPIEAIDNENPFIDILEDAHLLTSRTANRLRTPEQLRHQRNEGQALFILIFAFANFAIALLKLFVWK